MANFEVAALGDGAEDALRSVVVADIGIENNLYIYVDGKEYGSLFFDRLEDGRLVIELGQYDVVEQHWVDRNPVGVIPDEAQIPIQ